MKKSSPPYAETYKSLAGISNISPMLSPIDEHSRIAEWKLFVTRINASPTNHPFMQADERNGSHPVTVRCTVSSSTFTLSFHDLLDSVQFPGCFSGRTRSGTSELGRKTETDRCFRTSRDSRRSTCPSTKLRWRIACEWPHDETVPIIVAVHIFITPFRAPRARVIVISPSRCAKQEVCRTNFLSPQMRPFSRRVSFTYSVPTLTRGKSARRECVTRTQPKAAGASQIRPLVHRQAHPHFRYNSRPR